MLPILLACYPKYHFLSANKSPAKVGAAIPFSAEPSIEWLDVHFVDISKGGLMAESTQATTCKASMQPSCTPSELICLAVVLLLTVVSSSRAGEGDKPQATAALELDWQQLPDLPDPLGVAGPFVGIHHDALILAGGANFPLPHWENDKQWHSDIHVMIREGPRYRWMPGGVLPRRLAYGAAVSTPDGIVCMGGNDGEQFFRDVFLLKWDSDTQQISSSEYPPLPKPCAYGQAVLVGNVIYLAGGQSGAGLDTAMKNVWALDLAQRAEQSQFIWKELPSWPGPVRAFNITTHQHNGYEEVVYVMSGRRLEGGSEEFLHDLWEYSPSTRVWRRRSDLPRAAMAGTAIGYGQSHILLLGGDDGTYFHQADQLKDDHPGFPKEAWVYHTITDTWHSAGQMPCNQVTTIPITWDDRIVIASGEIRPRVRIDSRLDSRTCRTHSPVWQAQLCRAVRLLALDGGCGRLLHSQKQEHK